MLKYTVNLSADQPAQEASLMDFQIALAQEDIFLDMSLEDDKPRMHFYFKRKPLGKSAPADAENPPAPQAAPKKGRPRVAAENDISLETALLMLSTGLTAQEVADYIGVSRRTFFRRLSEAKRQRVDLCTPFSDWM